MSECTCPECRLRRDHPPGFTLLGVCFSDPARPAVELHLDLTEVVPQVAVFSPRSLVRYVCTHCYECHEVIVEDPLRTRVLTLAQAGLVGVSQA